MTTATEAAAARGIRVEPMAIDPWGNNWKAVIPRRGRGHQQPLAVMLANTPEGAARVALTYDVSARGWQA